MAISLVLLSLATILALAAPGLPWSIPGVPLTAPAHAAWRWLPPLLALAGFAAATRDLARRAPSARAAAAREAAPLLFFPALFAWTWGALGEDGWRAADVAGLLALAALAALLLARGLRAGDGLGFARAPLRPALRALRLPTTFMVLLPVAGGLFAHSCPSPAGVALSLATYPLYALVQLLVCCVLPLPCLRRLGARPAAATATVAILFALVHWPNGALMLGCLLAMLVWATVYQRHPSVPALALSMGLAATAFTQALPESLTQHARVGPRCARQLAVTAVAAAAADTTDVATLARAAYPVFAGRPARDAEARLWTEAMATGLRRRAAWQFLTSDEARARPAADPAPRARRWWLEPAARRDAVVRLGAPAYRVAAGGDNAAFLRALYRDVLGREATAPEVAAWHAALAPDRLQREALATALWDARRALARAPADSLTARALRLP